MTDFQRLILALPPTTSSDHPFERETPRTPASARAVSTAPAAQSTDGYARFLRTDETLSRYFVVGQNPAAMAESVRGWFQGDGPQAVEARGNYIARDTALSLTFVAFHESRNLEERRRLLGYFLEGMRGFVEPLRLLRREGRPESLTDSADAILRVSVLAGLFLRDLEASEISSEELSRAQDGLRAALREIYGVVDGAVGDEHPDWRHLQELVRALNLAQQPPTGRQSMGEYIDWIREIHGHLDRADAALNDRSEYREEISSLIQNTRSALPPVPTPTALARTFISHTTASFVTLVGSEIDQEDGDSAGRVRGRYEGLMGALEEDLAAHPDSTFEASLGRLATQDANHLRVLIENSAVLRELVAADREALNDAGSLNTGQIVSRWGESVVNRLERHSLNWGENFLARGEQHLGATRGILQFFRRQEGSGPSLRSALTEFAGQESGRSISERLTSRADAEWRSLDSTGFGIASGASHFFSIRSVPFVVGGALLSRLSTWILFAFAGENGNLVWRGISAFRSVPVLRSIPILGRTAFIEGGEMAGAGRFLSATMTGTGLSLGFSGRQLVSDLTAGRPEAWGNFGRNVGLGILVNSLALGLSALLTAGLRRALATPRGAAAAPVAPPAGRFSTLLDRLVTPRRALLYYGSHAAIGTAGMIGTNALVRGFHNAGLPEGERVPYTGADEVTETFLNLIAMNLAELPMQRVAMRRQLGSYRTTQLETLSGEIAQGLGVGPEAILTRERIFQSLALRSLRGVPLETLRSEAFRDYAARTFLPARPATDPEGTTSAGAGTSGNPQGTSAADASSQSPSEPDAEGSSGERTTFPPEPPAIENPSPGARADSSPAEAGSPPQPEAPRSSSDASATLRTSAADVEEGGRHPRSRELAQTIRGTGSDTNTQILQPQRNFLIRLRDRILASRSHRRYVLVTLRETGNEFDPEASLRTVRYQETLPEPRHGQIVLERRSVGSDHQRIFLVGENLEGVSPETRTVMNLFLRQFFPLPEGPSAQSAPPSPNDSEGGSPRAASEPPPPPRPPSRPTESADSNAAPAEPAQADPSPPVATGDSIESVFAGLAQEVEAEGAGAQAADPLSEAVTPVPQPTPVPPRTDPPPVEAGADASAGEGSGTHRIPTPPPRSSSPEVAELSDPFGTPPPASNAWASPHASTAARPSRISAPPGNRPGTHSAGSRHRA